MTPEEFAAAVAEALDMAKQITAHAEQYGWVAPKAPRANKKFAFVTLRRDLGNEWGAEEIRAFYAIDPDSDSDQVTYVDVIGAAKVLDPESGDVREAIENDFHVKPQQPSGADDSERTAAERAVPPTSAAHSAAHPPVPPIVPPTDAAHTDSDDSAAHSDGDSAAHPAEQTVSEFYGTGPKADEAAVAAEALGHKAAAEKAKPKDAEHATWSQQGTYAAVRGQQANPDRNWSKVASELSNAEILARLGKGMVELVWRNSLSGALDRAVVDAEGGKHPPHITPAEFDPIEFGEDLRILHFLEVSGGFRSVALARVTKIG
ncbi:hypothetical protein KNU79_gp76 [Gordonia phage NadineRae]|uniref:Uncharacterized protein n=1 Tax=Gordonia phage NadineRae TaxID=2652882 RepID=A0A5P8DH81_9CAUD|nr:hypothetical protein KNU79_gp76 [Gordonia phage NadineRae]QFP97759.1 hypothetical protein SEA_NADINERAE_76 [Gordonia phage NadineRae]